MKYEIREAKYYIGEEPKPCKEAVKGEDGCWYINIHTLKDLDNLMAESDNQLILSDGNDITIYNDYVE